MKYNNLITKWILPLITLVFGFFSFGSFMDSTLGKEDLIEVSNQIASIEYYESNARFSSKKNMQIRVNNGKTYKVGSEWSNKFEQIEKEKLNSNRIKLYHRYSSQTVWRLGTENIIYHLEIGTHVIIDIDERARESKTVGYLFGSLSIISLITFIFRRRKIPMPNTS